MHKTIHKRFVTGCATFFYHFCHCAREALRLKPPERSDKAIQTSVTGYCFPNKTLPEKNDAFLAPLARLPLAALAAACKQKGYVVPPFVYLKYLTPLSKIGIK
jgi:hypothetical protein